MSDQERIDSKLKENSPAIQIEFYSCLIDSLQARFIVCSVDRKYNEKTFAEVLKLPETQKNDFMSSLSSSDKRYFIKCKGLPIEIEIAKGRTRSTELDQQLDREFVVGANNFMRLHEMRKNRYKNFDEEFYKRMRLDLLREIGNLKYPKFNELLQSNEALRNALMAD